MGVSVFPSSFYDLGDYHNYDNGPLGSRNIIRNGGFTIWQRGYPITHGANSRTYGADGWAAHCYLSTGVITTTRGTAALATPPTEHEYYCRATAATADSSLASGDYYAITQRVEGWDMARLSWGTSRARAATLSFWVRASMTGTFGVSCRDGAYAYSCVNTFTISSANTWEFKTVSITPPTSVGTFTNGESSGLELFFVLGSGTLYQTASVNTWVSGAYITTSSQTQLISTTNATFDLAGVQLEVGNVVTPFDRLPHQQELARNQRYFWNRTSTSTYDVIGNGQWTGAASFGALVRFPVPMRAAPSVSWVNLRAHDPSFGARTVSGTSGTATSTEGHTLATTTTAGGATAGQACNVFFDAGVVSTTYFQASAEL